MRIKRLEICGFKSFVDRTVLTFDDPITGVVGPNGCGKSNIVDAIRWVMGEQSAKHLRGRAMEDVIFSGSESRGPAGLAEVSITFDTAALPGDVAPGGVPWGAAGPADVVVTRRLYRGGESEYLLGGVPCRLRDIVEFFLGTGVGSKAYAIIEQGRIGFIVSSRPEDRRTLIDEAAGITKYKAKKKVAERRMEATRQHLLRVTDIIGEIETRLRSLKLQAQKAERYKRYKAELKDLELGLATQKHLGLLAEQKYLVAAHAALQTQHADETGSLVAEEASVEAERLALAEDLAELSKAKEELFALDNKAQLSAQRAEHYQDESAMLVVRAEHARKESDALAQRAEQNTETLASTEGQVAMLDAEAEARIHALEAMEQTCAEAKSELATARRQLDQAVAGAGAARTRIARLESDVESARVRAEDLARRLEELLRDEAASSEALVRMTGEAAEAGERAGELQARAEVLVDKKAQYENQASTLRGEVARGEIRARNLARGSAPAALAVAVPGRDPGALRELPAGRSRHHAEGPRVQCLARERAGRRWGGREQDVDDARGARSGGRYRAAAAGAGNRARSRAGRAAWQHHRRIPRGRRRGHRLSQGAKRGAIQLHPPVAACVGADRRGRVRCHGRRGDRGHHHGPGARRVAERRGRARADARAHRVRPALRSDCQLSARRCHRGRGSAQGPGALAADQDAEDAGDPGWRSHRPPRRRDRRLARVGGGRRALAEARDARARRDRGPSRSGLQGDPRSPCRQQTGTGRDRHRARRNRRCHAPRRARAGCPQERRRSSGARADPSGSPPGSAGEHHREPANLDKPEPGSHRGRHLATRDGTRSGPGAREPRRRAARAGRRPCREGRRFAGRAFHRECGRRAGRRSQAHGARKRGTAAPGDRRFADQVRTARRGRVEGSGPRRIVAHPGGGASPRGLVAPVRACRAFARLR